MSQRPCWETEESSTSWASFGGRYSIDFAVDVAIAKFADHLPLERQVRQMARDGLDVDSSTLWEQTWFLSQHLLPTYEANHAHVLSADVIAVDET